jgi:hypothetical protein
MRAAEAVAAARDWVLVRARNVSGFRGAFLTGSAASAPGSASLPPWSDVDVAVVVAGEHVPPKLGKFRHRGVLLDVAFHPEARFADAGEIAASAVLAPGLAAGRILLDPTGRLHALHAAIAPRFAEPAAVRRRCADVLDAICAGMTALDQHGPWHEQIIAWMFPSSRVTHVVLVAALQNPTVRLRYRAAREVLHAAGRPDLYESFLALLGCADVAAGVVRHHLDRLAVLFEETVAVAHTPFPFSTDLTAEARPIAIDGSAALLEVGDHREAVFWIVATFARCQYVLTADAAPALRRTGEAALRTAVADLLGLTDTEGLRARAAATLALLPAVREAAEVISGGDAEGSASWSAE